MAEAGGTGVEYTGDTYPGSEKEKKNEGKSQSRQVVLRFFWLPFRRNKGGDVCYRMSCGRAAGSFREGRKTKIFFVWIFLRT